MSFIQKDPKPPVRGLEETLRSCHPPSFEPPVTFGKARGAAGASARSLPSGRSSRTPFSPPACGIAVESHRSCGCTPRITLMTQRRRAQQYIRTKPVTFSPRILTQMSEHGTSDGALLGKTTWKNALCNTALLCYFETNQAANMFPKLKLM